jgi:hypothetical protein
MVKGNQQTARGHQKPDLKVLKDGIGIDVLESIDIMGSHTEGLRVTSTLNY